MLLILQYSYYNLSPQTTPPPVHYLTINAITSTTTP